MRRIFLCFVLVLHSPACWAYDNFVLFAGAGLANPTTGGITYSADVLDMRNSKSYMCVVNEAPNGDLSPMQCNPYVQFKGTLLTGENIRTSQNAGPASPYPDKQLHVNGVWQIDAQTGSLQYCVYRGRACVSYKLP